MERAIEEIRRELRHWDSGIDMAMSEGDYGLTKFCMGAVCGLGRALAILDGDKATEEEDED